MKSAKLWSSLPIKKAACCLMAAAMIMPVSACKKKGGSSANGNNQYVSGKEILATDPFFTAEINELKLPIDESKEVDFLSIDEVSFVSGVVIASYNISYKIPKDVNFGSLTYEEGKEYWKSATGVFDDKGNFLREVSGDGYNLLASASDPDGNIYILQDQFDMNIGMTYEIKVMDKEGNPQKTIQFDIPPMDNSTIATPHLGVMGDGKITLTVAGVMKIYNQNGKKISEISDIGRSIEGSLIQQDGKYYVLSSIYEMGGEADVQIKEVNIDTGELGQGKQANALSSYSNPTATEEGIFVTSANACFRYDIKSGEIEEIFNWNDTDVNRAVLNRNSCIPVSDDEIYAIGSQFLKNGMKSFLIHLTRADKNPHAGKKMIIVGGEYITYNDAMMTFVDEYNRDVNNKARVILFDYTDSAVTDEEVEEAETKLLLDILSGAGPDILVNMGGRLQFNNVQVMEDLNKYIDGENGIDRGEYFDNIFRACEMNGKLYHVPINVALIGLQANSNQISNKEGWTFDEFDHAFDTVPDGVSFIEGIEYDELLTDLLGSMWPDLVNYSDKTVNFESEDMVRVLDLVKKFGVKEKPDDEGMDLEYDGNGAFFATEDRTQVKFREGLLAVRNASVASLGDYCVKKSILDGNSSFLGYPSKNGSGMSIYSDMTLGIVAFSKYKDLAWDFIRAYLDYEAPDDLITFTFPVKKETFELMCREDMQEQNEQYEDSMKEAGPEGTIGFFAPVSEEDIAEVRALLENATISFRSADIAILNIVREEAAAFFAGDRTEAEVLKNIQNRAATVVKEQS